MIETLIFLYLLLFGLFLISLTVVACVFPEKRKKNTLQKCHSLSVVIPCRNEAKHLAALVSSLEKQDEADNFDIIFIDDGSTDGTMELLRKIQHDSTLPITILRGKYDPARRLTSKQQALDLGIRESNKQYIALTDADMVFERTWIRSLTGSITSGVDLVFGHTSIISERTPFILFQAFQLEFLFSVAAVFHYAGIAGSCMGNNLLFRKQAYTELGGFDEIGYSITEDRALLYTFHKKKRNITIATPFIPTAFTYPHRSIQTFVSQLRRWALGGFSTGLGLLFIGICLEIQNIFTLISVTGLFSITTRITAWTNIVVIWFLISILFKKNHSKITPLLYPVFYPIFILESLLFPLLMIGGKKISWKGRILNS
jgi:cellulose synthase/poly-beta-1,6-N-acetylglucosamine synthase-like glycosyltransferase